MSKQNSEFKNQQISFINVKNKQLLGLITSVFSLSFSLSFGIIIKLQQETKLRKKKHNKLLYLAKNKLDCIGMLISNSIKDGKLVMMNF